MAALPKTVTLNVSLGWQDGPPTKTGLYVIEWGNCGGLATYIVVKRDTGLHYLDTEMHYPKRDGIPVKNWYVIRHLEIPQTPAHNQEYNAESAYSDAYDVNEEDWKLNIEEKEKRRRFQDTCVKCGHYPNWWPILKSEQEKGI